MGRRGHRWVQKNTDEIGRSDGKDHFNPQITPMDADFVGDESEKLVDR
jgi:hypothetical protein